MKFTLNDCMQRINQILNFPSVTYEDIYHFFDHAIAELNTILKIALPPVSEMVSNNTLDISLQENTVLLTSVPTNASPIRHVTTVPTGDPTEADPALSTYCFYTGDTLADNKFYIWSAAKNEWRSYNSLYGVYFGAGTKTTYVATPVAASAFWVATPSSRTLDFDLCDYLTMDWWTLFVIPYVCFKFAVRNGDDGSLYSTEFTQGLQQLQTCYDVPNFVSLNRVAGNPVYTKIVKDNINNLSKTVPTMAITKDMRVGNAIRAVFSNEFSVGGWGI